MMRERDPEHIPAAVEARRLAYQLDELLEQGDWKVVWIQAQIDHLRRMTGWRYDVDGGSWIFEDIIPDRPGSRAYPAHRDDFVTDDFESWWKNRGICPPRVGLEGFSA